MFKTYKELKLCGSLCMFMDNANCSLKFSSCCSSLHQYPVVDYGSEILLTIVTFTCKFYILHLYCWEHCLKSISQYAWGFGYLIDYYFNVSSIGEVVLPCWSSRNTWTYIQLQRHMSTLTVTSTAQFTQSKS